LILLASSLACTVALSTTACGSSTQTPTPLALRALSSISDGAVLSDPVRWTATAAGVPATQVGQVDFLIDGRVRWIEHHPPYVFNGDGDELFPWLLGPGGHRLAVRIVTRTGATGSTVSSVTVSIPAPIPVQLLGTFSRTVTVADVLPPRPSPHEPRGEALLAGVSRGEALLAGVWRLRVQADGSITINAPDGAASTEAFLADPDGILTLEGPANWLRSDDRQSGFCEIETIGAYTWSAHARSLVVTPQHDTCTKRSSVFAGDWRRT
jgi:hypothetical protein